MKKFAPPSQSIKEKFSLFGNGYDGEGKMHVICQLPEKEREEGEKFGDRKVGMTREKMILIYKNGSNPRCVFLGLNCCRKL